MPVQLTFSHEVVMKIWPLTFSSKECQRGRAVGASIGVEKVLSVSLILVTGIVVATIVFALEKIVKRWDKSEEDNKKAWIRDLEEKKMEFGRVKRELEQLEKRVYNMGWERN